MSGYQGMRWFKCDLQVQTPEDSRHWDPEDTGLRLGSPEQRQEQDLQEKARRYLRRCHEVGLDVIGVTDHNFCGHREHRRRFLTHLIEQNKTVAEEVGRSPLWIFPGFEVDIGYHVLCLFPPIQKTSPGLDRLCNVLTHLGLGPENRFDGNGPKDLRSDGQYVSLSKILRVVQEEHEGIVIAAHAFGRDGIAYGDGTYSGDFQNEDLLAVEVSGPSLNSRERSILEARDGKWARSRPLARIMSSDAKSTLADEIGAPNPNSLGYRSTWIKMSEPSIEALRQAFLDWRSRIRLEGDPRVVKHDQIKSLSVQGAVFLEDQEVLFSPHLNCLIGGRGSGKSSLFESIRFALRREDEPAAREQVSRIRDTLNPDARLRLTWRERDNSMGVPGPEDTFEYRPSSGRSQVVSRQVSDASTIFQGLGVQVFSQREISEVARTADFLLRLVDDLVGPRLRDLRQQETELKERIRTLQSQEQTLERLKSEVSSLEQEVQELERRWAARSAVQEEQKRHRAAQEALRYLEQVEDRTSKLESAIVQWAADLAESHAPLGSAVKSWPESAFFEALDAETEKARQQLADDMIDAAGRYRIRIQKQTQGSAHLPTVQEAISAAERAFREACSRQGLQPQDLEQLFQLDQQRRAKALELESKRSRAAETARAVQGLGELRSQLLDIWRDQTKARKEELDTILGGEAIPRVPMRIAEQQQGERPTLEVHIEFQSDRADFLRHWSELSPDARTRLGRQWEELGESVFEEFRSMDLSSPWEVVQRWLQGNAPALPADLLLLLREQLLSRRRETWDAKQLVRIQDDVDLILYRSDGTRAGSLRQKQLSDGQRNTAILMLLLASGQGPILIDQPEDELDSSFIFEQLVPLLREIKHHRQVIVVTHNPNLPVNADAELVYALKAEAVDGKAQGRVRAQGGLDRQGVKQAVLDIMEGSEEAFRQRREKYHF